MAKTPRALWCDRVRHQLKPGEKQPCAICNQFESIAHAHHVSPVALQHDAGLKEPVHEHEWLCPTHHSLVHLAIEAAMKGEAPEGIPEAEQGAVYALALKGLGRILKQVIEEQNSDE